MEQTSPILTQMLNETQTARLLAVSVAALRRWRREGRGPQFLRLGKCIRYDVRAIEYFLAENSSGNKKTADSVSATDREAHRDHAALDS
jgi:predicted site-specific integrase-resolvase